MSGHLFFKERWYGFDDGLYAAARLLEILSAASDPSAMLEGLPQSCATPEIKLETAEGEQFALVERCARRRISGAQSINDLDGVRVDYVDGFGLARPSNTTPTVVLRFEGDTMAALARIEEDFRNALRRARLMSVYRSKEHYAMDRAEFAREEAQAAGLLDCAEWRAFDHAARCAELDAGALKLIEAAGLSLDLSMQRQSPALEAAGRLARPRRAEGGAGAVRGRGGELTEDKPAWHTALRAGRTREQPDGQDAGSVWRVRAHAGLRARAGPGGGHRRRAAYRHRRQRLGPRLAVQAFGGPTQRRVRSVSFRISTAMRSTTR